MQAVRSVTSSSKFSHLQPDKENTELQENCNQSCSSKVFFRIAEIIFGPGHASYSLPEPEWQAVTLTLFAKKHQANCNFRQFLNENNDSSSKTQVNSTITYRHLNKVAHKP